jgi:nicotinamidase-related amidase
MSDLILPARYFQDSTPEGTPCREENFIRREVEMKLPLAQTALILVDMWDRHHIASWVERVHEVNISKIVPVMEEVRRIGMHIIHAPCPEVAARFPQTISEPPVPDPTLPSPDWPPAEFRRREGEFAAFRSPRHQPPGMGGRWNAISDGLTMTPDIEVRDEDSIVATGDQLHRVLARRKILFTIYAGYASNWCLMHRNYGIRAMSSYGYFILLLRDCTLGVEFPDTVENNFVTEMTIREVEQQKGFSVGNPEFLAACARLTT